MEVSFANQNPFLSFLKIVINKTKIRFNVKVYLTRSNIAVMQLKSRTHARNSTVLCLLIHRLTTTRTVHFALVHSRGLRQTFFGHIVFAKSGLILRGKLFYYLKLHSFILLNTLSSHKIYLKREFLHFFI